MNPPSCANFKSSPLKLAQGDFSRIEFLFELRVPSDLKEGLLCLYYVAS
jgi:hypothetical protein